MTKFLADENFNNQIIRGVFRRNPGVNIIRIQDVGLSGIDDTHDVATMITFAYKRIEAGLSMPGLFEVNRQVQVGLAIEEIILIADYSIEGEWEGQVRFLPLR